MLTKAEWLELDAVILREARKVEIWVMDPDDVNIHPFNPLRIVRKRFAPDVLPQPGTPLFEWQTYNYSASVVHLNLFNPLREPSNTFEMLQVTNATERRTTADNFAAALYNFRIAIAKKEPMAAAPTLPILTRWRTPDTIALAQAALQGDWSACPILADALEEEGCYNIELLNKLRARPLHWTVCVPLVDIVNAKATVVSHNEPGPRTEVGDGEETADPTHGE